ncbi:transposase [Pseudoroseomonas wenyumeiae]
MILDLHRERLLISAIVRGRASTARRCVEPPHFHRTVGGLVNGHLDQLRDRLSFMRFAGLDLHQAVPDARTNWLCREQLKQVAPSRGYSAASTGC